MHNGKRLRVAFLADAYTHAVRLAVESVCRLPCVKPSAILLASRNPDGLTDRLARSVIHEGDALKLLRAAFPYRPFVPDDLERLYGLVVATVDTLGSRRAFRLLGQIGADLAVYLGSGSLRDAMYRVPPLGTVALDLAGSFGVRKARPGFRELYEGSKTAWVAVRRMDMGAPDETALAARELRIHPLENEESLQAKLAVEGAALLSETLSAIAEGIEPQADIPPEAARNARRPARRQRLDLEARAPRAAPMHGGIKRVAKTALYLGFNYLGGRGLVSMTRKAAGVSRGRVLLFHRVNDLSDDPLTTSTVSFAETLATLKKYYSVRSTAWLVGQLLKGGAIPSDTVVIHFDDCYRDVYQNAVPLLEAAGFPATFFLSSGYIDSDKVFQHDSDSYPFTFENLRSEEVREMSDKGFEIGAHTVNHVDLGAAPIEQAEREILKSRADLEALTGKPVRYFSFPFGGPSNIRVEARKLVEEAGFQALFSAHGGAVLKGCDRFDIPRMGVSARHRPLDLLMEMEGVALSDARRFIRGLR